MITKITYHLMPWEIDYALQSFTQFKKSKYYLQEGDTVKIDSFLNLSNYIIDWDKSKLPKEFFIQKYKDLSNLLIDYDHTPFIYEGDELFGILDKQRMAYSPDVDYYIELCPDMYFSETLLASLIESAKVVPNKYFAITPQLYKMWDWTWDLFDIRWDFKNANIERQLKSSPVSKWCNWFDLYNKAFYEEMIPAHDDWHGYGPGDTYGMIISEYAKKHGADFQQYILEGELIFEYPIGPLKQRNVSSVYRDMIVTKDVPNQRVVFEAKFNDYLNIGVQQLIDKKII